MFLPFATTYLYETRFFFINFNQNNISQHMKEADVRIHLPFINQRLKRFEKKKNNAILPTKFDLEIKLFFT